MSEIFQFPRVIDPRIDIQSTRQRMFGILDSGTDQTWQEYVSTTFNNSQISWNGANPPNDGVYTNRRMYVQMRFTITFTGQSLGPGVHLLQAKGLPSAPGVSSGLFTYDAPRCLPLSQCISTQQVQMNNDRTSSNLNMYSRVFQRFYQPYDEENLDMSGSPAMPDKSWDYDFLQGAALNPLGAYGDNTVQIPRGAFTGCLVTRNDSTGLPGDIATVECTFTEPFYLSPWSWQRGQEDVAFIQLRTLDVVFTLGGRGNSGTLAGLAAALWSHSPAGSTLSSASVNVTGGSLFFNYISPSPITQIPPSIVYSYYEPTLYPTTYNNAILPGQRVRLTLNNVQLNSVPNRIYLYACERDQDNDITKTDTYFRIDQLQITYQNRSGLLSNASPYDLYQMYVRNGGNMSFQQWWPQNGSGVGVGSIACVTFGTDLPLGPDSAPGLVTAQNITVYVDVTNNTNRNIFPTLYMLAIGEGVMYINSGQITKSLGVINQADILASKSSAPLAMKPARTFWGSGFFDDVGSFFKKLVRPAINVAQSLVPAQFQPLVQGADAVAKSYGLGLESMGVQKGFRGSALLTKGELAKLK